VERLSLSEVRPSAVFSFLETCGWVAVAYRPCEFHLGFFGVAFSHLLAAIVLQLQQVLLAYPYAFEGASARSRWLYRSWTGSWRGTFCNFRQTQRDGMEPSTAYGTGRMLQGMITFQFLMTLCVMWITVHTEKRDQFYRAQVALPPKWEGINPNLALSCLPVEPTNTRHFIENAGRIWHKHLQLIFHRYPTSYLQHFHRDRSKKYHQQNYSSTTDILY
jgi:hypothetical protein